jgi:hypothetical protein
MNDHQTQIDLLEQEMLDRLLTAQLATTFVIQQAQEKMAERFGQRIGELKNAEAPPSHA